MRIGQNPAKSISYVAKPKDVTVAIVTYIPFLNGYYAQSLDVLKECIASLHENTKHPFELLIFDNGSDVRVRNYLQDQYSQGTIQYLVFSEKNLGKGGAWNFIFGSSPGEYLAYADGDILFHEGWLSESLEILETYPNVGMVTARPLRSKDQHFFSTTLEWAQENSEAHLEKGHYMDWRVFNEHALSCGVPVEQSKGWFKESCDWKVDYRGITAFAGAAHFQFLARKSVLQEFLPFEMDKPMGQVRTLDDQLNKAGFLRLMTPEPRVSHMGNTLNLGKEDQLKTVPTGKSKGFFEWRPIKKVLMFVYQKIFQIYYGSVDK